MSMLRSDGYDRAAEWSLLQWWRFLQQVSLAKSGIPLSPWLHETLFRLVLRNHLLFDRVIWLLVDLLLCSRLCVCVWLQG